MPVKLKTKTVIDALQSLRLIPSFTTQFSGDVLPEAILLKNILEEMLYSIETLSNLESYFEAIQSDETVDFASMTSNEQLNSGLEKFHRTVLDYKTAEKSKKASTEGGGTEYDADSEAVTPKTAAASAAKPTAAVKKSAFASFKSAVRRSSRKSIPLSDRLRHQELLNKIRSKEHRLGEMVIRSARSLLLVIQNDSSLSILVERLVEGRGVSARLEMVNLTKVLEEFDAYAVSSIGVPYEARTQEVEALCGSIFMTQKFDKSVRKMRGVLEEIQESRRVQMAKKVEEKTELEAAGEEIRQRSRTIISEIRKNVDERVRAMAWKSHARQIKIGDVVTRLKSELKESTHDHIELETRLRHENNRLETEIQSMIEHYDSEMFRRHRDIERISAEYDDEKDTLATAIEDLRQIEEKKEVLMEEQRREEEEERNAILNVIRRKMAAKSIQRGWRAHVTRRLLKSKKKKKKKAAV